LWNLKVKENNVLAYTERFQELTLICTKFVANETEKINKYVSRLPVNTYGSVKASKSKTLDETIELANDLMDQKIHTYAERQSNNKRKADESFGNANVANAQRNNGENPKGNGCYECEATWHFKRDCPKLKNKDGEKVNAPGWVYVVGNAEKRRNASRDPDLNGNIKTLHARVEALEQRAEPYSPIPTSDPIISSSSPSFTPFEGNDFILEEIKTFLRTMDELSNLNDDYYNTEGDILYLEKLLNEDPSLNFPPVKTEDLKQVDVTMTKPLIEEPPELKLNELPSHLEYAFL
nr:reverse transcriptase domain-containing protein [Tanacetum cinerariifolium]